MPSFVPHAELENYGIELPKGRMRLRRRVIELVLAIVTFVFTINMLDLGINTATDDSRPVIKDCDTVHKPSEDDDLNTILSEEYERQPFEPDSPKMVVVMTYQRSGSSFFGEIFDRNPYAFYVYEPLDALYTSMYGTAEGWNIPSDIKNFWNGTERILPRHEIEAVAQFLENLLTCKTQKLPTEFYKHSFWKLMTSSFQSGQRIYNQCIAKLSAKVYSCARLITKTLCPQRFGQDWKKLEYCRKELVARDTEDSKILQYKECNKQARQELDSCIPLLSRNCSEATLHATKTVRATMPSMDLLLERNPNLRVIYLVRDPRAVVLSRMKFPSARGVFSHDDYVTESMLFCRSAVRDLHLFKTLQAKHSGKMIQVVYDDFVKDPLRYTKAIYRFLDSKIPKQTMKWLVTNTQVRKNSTLIARKWQGKVPYKKVLQINKYCKDYMELIRYPWD